MHDLCLFWVTGSGHGDCRFNGDSCETERGGLLLAVYAHLPRDLVQGKYIYDYVINFLYLSIMSFHLTEEEPEVISEYTRERF